MPTHIGAVGNGDANQKQNDARDARREKQDRPLCWVNPYPKKSDFLGFRRGYFRVKIRFFVRKKKPLGLFGRFCTEIEYGLKKNRKIHENIYLASFQLKALKYKFWEP